MVCGRVSPTNVAALPAAVAVLGLVMSQPAAAFQSLAAESGMNIYGEPLHKCDRSHVDDPRYPTTGFMRGDMCTATAEDAGSHFVCVNLPEGNTPSGKKFSPFWTVTGQARSPEAASTWPLPGPWCICMWAYARMRDHHPEFQGYLNCPATHAWVVDSYNPSIPTERDALVSVCEECDVAAKSKNQQLAEKCRRATAFA